MTTTQTPDTVEMLAEAAQIRFREYVEALRTAPCAAEAGARWQEAWFTLHEAQVRAKKAGR